MFKTCEVCKENYWTTKKTSRFCSRKCRGIKQVSENQTFMECGLCGNLFQVRNCRIEHRKKMYCSPEHAYLAQQGQPSPLKGRRKYKLKNCPYCGNEFNPAKHKKYCSDDCYLKDHSIEKNCRFCGIKFRISKRKVEKRGAGAYCSPDCKEFARDLYVKWPYGSAVTIITRNCAYCGEDFSYRAGTLVRKFCSSHCSSKANYTPFHGYGENHWNWKGGFPSDLIKVRKSAKYYKWQKEVFSRDNKICQECGKTNCEVHAHHIFEFAKYPEHRFKAWNGLTLCRDCHMDIHDIKALM